MKFVYVLIAVAVAPGLLTGQQGAIRVERVDEPGFVRLLNSATMQELNELQPRVAKTLSLRLFSVAVQGACVEHTHWVCEHDYFLAVSEHDEYPAQSVYSLGRLGEIVGVEWLPGALPDRALLQVVVSNYALSALKEQATLQREDRRYRLEVSVAALAVTAVAGARP